MTDYLVTLKESIYCPDGNEYKAILGDLRDYDTFEYLKGYLTITVGRVVLQSDNVLSLYRYDNFQRHKPLPGTPPMNVRYSIYDARKIE